MGSGISGGLARLLAERKLVEARISRDMILKEVEAAQMDLQDARDSVERNRFKWATIQGYYSMFHGARALLFSRGFREKSHYALLLALRELFSGVRERSLIERFQVFLRQAGDGRYGLKFSEVG